MLTRYLAQTDSFAFLLDDQGVCLSIRALRADVPAAAEAHMRRCIGAQFVAALDLRVSGGLCSFPAPGAQLLFARRDEEGRMALLRSGPIHRFERRAVAAPPSCSVVHPCVRAAVYDDGQDTEVFARTRHGDGRVIELIPLDRRSDQATRGPFGAGPYSAPEWDGDFASTMDSVDVQLDGDLDWCVPEALDGYKTGTSSR